MVAGVIWKGINSKQTTQAKTSDLQTQEDTQAKPRTLGFRALRGFWVLVFGPYGGFGSWFSGLTGVLGLGFRALVFESHVSLQYVEDLEG